MKCAICRNGNTVAGTITVALDKEETTLVFKNVPAQICDNCGEEYLSSETNKKLLQLANDAVRRGVSLELLKYAA
ncbi:MAG: YgiT-type zinc finger protein [Candidatus Aminicenantes bacterium]|nr:YgiT-type zinc finger protein [Candidatus Aminicenantes bacterium]NIM80198.1 YgiT-type zinc finger protein [Candidatus Aminicenantes bacterium]NIN19537.1 YgiT-type zinc finger protein [Candidatus Aminicenantes bacterium]NIN43431.1 YgiT-type zinc finger protein [Candidatus Aminicenantes bacterium]NIN86176.1 YgiT-type zinc finger protein [Candidatus Aminicenantes bacterium]